MALAAPNNLTVPLYESLAYIGCTAAKGQTTPEGVMVLSMTKFTTLNVARVDGTQMTYYRSYATRNTDTGSLLLNRDGQCSSWAHLFLDVLKVQGIDQPNNYVLVTPLAADDGFIVDNWAFSTTPSGTGAYPWQDRLAGDITVDLTLLFSRPGLNSYNWLMGADVTDTPGLAGQGNGNPASLFSNHQFVQLTLFRGTTIYFDPSYGAFYQSLQDFDDNRLAGYFIFTPYDPVTNTTTFAFRKNVIGTLEVTRDPLITDY